MNRFDGQVAIVTGGARGIGAATVRRLVSEGASVLIADVIDADGEALASELTAAGGKAAFIHLDVASESEWTQGAERAASLGTLTVLVNNAGIASHYDVERETLEAFENCVRINQTGTWLGMKAVMPVMRKNGGGSIVNVSSIYATSGGTGGAIAYHGAKAAVAGMTKSAAVRYAKEGIRVNSVHPGFIHTPMTGFTEGDHPKAKAMRDFVTTSVPMARMGKPDELASAIAFLASADASFITGTELYVDGGFKAW